MMSFDVLNLRGTPIERGKQHGKKLKEEIEKNVEVYRRMFCYESVDIQRARELAGDHLSRIESLNPKYAEEIEGISEGSDVPLLDVALLNVRYEVIYTAWKEQASEVRQMTGAPPDESGNLGADGCTSFGVMGSVSQSGKSYIGENWDWFLPLEDTVALTRVLRQDAPDHLVFTEAGIVGGKCGVNECGVGVALNGLNSAKDGVEPDRKPIHVRCREVMNGVSLREAIQPAIETERPVSANFMIGCVENRPELSEKAGRSEIINLELAPNRFSHIYPKSGIITHSNHFVADDIEGITQYGSSLYRDKRLRRHLIRSSNEGGVTLQQIKDGLRDHFSRPYSICSHPDISKDKQEQVQTNVSIIASLNDRVLHVVRGPPCCSEYKKYSVN